jgi:protein-disulfide isomerase
MKLSMFLRRILVLLLLVVLRATAQAPTTTTPASQAQLESKVEAYLRNLFAWGPDFVLKLGPFADAKVTHGEQITEGTIYVSKDGKFLVRGEIQDLAADPFATERKHLHLEGNPSKGPTDARVTVVEFSDFQCPHCRELYTTLKGLEPLYPQVRFVFKDCPLMQAHAWAMTAALASRCAYMSSPDTFWKVHDAIFDNQSLITVEDAYSQVVKFATDAGMSGDQIRLCMSSPEAKSAVEANVADAQALRITSTPTVFVNGRPIAGPSRELLDQYISYELAALRPRQP